MQQDRLQKLAQGLDTLAVKDDLRVRREQEIAELRIEAAVEMHEICADFVQSVNALLLNIRIELTPEEFSPRSFHEAGPNLFQMNASGRIVQVIFAPTDLATSTEEFQTPYTLQGAVRRFNQELLEGLGIREHLLLFCLDKRANYWLYFDPKTHRKGPFDENYLIEVFQELL